VAGNTEVDPANFDLPFSFPGRFNNSATVDVNKREAGLKASGSLILVEYKTQADGSLWRTAIDKHRGEKANDHHVGSNLPNTDTENKYR
jgi:hypothetical protein